MTAQLGVAEFEKCRSRKWRVSSPTGVRMSWQFIRWYAAHRTRLDKWEHITLFVCIATAILTLGRYPFYIMLAVVVPVAVLLGWLVRRRRARRMRLS
jgi:Flp pilus assembly protein TadB